MTGMTGSPLLRPNNAKPMTEVPGRQFAWPAGMPVAGQRKTGRDMRDQNSHFSAWPKVGVGAVRNTPERVAPLLRVAPLFIARGAQSRAVDW
jgi:hypothetical protein